MFTENVLLLSLLIAALTAALVLNAIAPVGLNVSGVVQPVSWVSFTLYGATVIILLALISHAADLFLS